MGGSDNKGDGLASQPRRYRVPGQPLLNRHQVGGVSRSPDGLFAQQEREPIRGRPALRGKRTYGGRPGQRVEEQGTWAAQKHSEAGYGRPVDRGVWTAKTVKRPRQQPAHPQYANCWAPLTRKRHTMPHSAQPQHANYWAPRTRKQHQQEHRPQRPTESSDPTQQAKGRTGDRPGPRKGATTRRNVTQGGSSGHLVGGRRRRPRPSNCRPGVFSLSKKYGGSDVEGAWGFEARHLRCVTRWSWGVARHKCESCGFHNAKRVRPVGTCCCCDWNVACCATPRHWPAVGSTPRGGGHEGRTELAYLKWASQFWFSILILIFPSRKWFGALGWVGPERGRPPPPWAGGCPRQCGCPQQCRGLLVIAEGSKARGQQAPPQANRANHQGLVPTPPPLVRTHRGSE